MDGGRVRQNTKILILGGGATSISTCHWLEARGEKDYLVLEKEANIGGMIRSVDADGRHYETSGHFLHCKDSKNLEFFKSKVPLTSKVREGAIYLDGELIEQPFQLNFLSIKNKGLRDKMFKEFVAAQLVDNGQYNNFEDFLKSRFGNSICDNFLFPYNRKLYGDLNELSINSMNRFFPNTSISQLLDHISNPQPAGYNAIIHMPTSGKFADLLECLDFDRSKVKLNTTISKIDLEARVIADTNGNEYGYNQLVSTIPFKSLLTMLGKTEDAAKFKARTINVFNMEIDKKNILWGKDWVYFPNPEFPFYRVGSYTNFTNKNQALHRLYVECPEDVTYTKAAAGLIKAGIIEKSSQITHWAPLKLAGAYNIIDEFTTSYVEAFQERMKDKITVLGRYGRWNYLSFEDCYIEGREAANNILGEAK